MTDRILIVEDNNDNMTLITWILEDGGYDFIGVPTAEQAIERLTQSQAIKNPRGRHSSTVMESAARSPWKPNSAEAGAAEIRRFLNSGKFGDGATEFLPAFRKRSPMRRTG